MLEPQTACLLHAFRCFVCLGTVLCFSSCPCTLGCRQLKRSVTSSSPSRRRVDAGGAANPFCRPSGTQPSSPVLKLTPVSPCPSFRQTPWRDAGQGPRQDTENEVSVAPLPLPLLLGHWSGGQGDHLLINLWGGRPVVRGRGRRVVIGRPVVRWRGIPVVRGKTVVRRRGRPVVRRRGRPVVRWRGRPVVRWRGRPVVRWRGRPVPAVVRWRGRRVVRWTGRRVVWWTGRPVVRGRGRRVVRWRERWKRCG